MSTDAPTLAGEDAKAPELGPETHKPSGRNIVIFADGTGQRGGLQFDERRSNIYKLYRATRCGPDSTINALAQTAFYDPGLGTLPGGIDSPAALGRSLYNLASQATGLGITSNIVDCYAAIIRSWQPGDRIFLFGFSRGAYTVRCLGGVLKLCGVPTHGAHSTPLRLDPKSIRKLAKEGVAIYNYTNSRPPRVRTLRQSELLSHRTLLAARFREKYGSDGEEGGNARPYFLGVFDTVASLANPTAIVILAAVSALIIALLSLASFWLPGSYWAWLGILAGGSALIALLANLISRFKIAFGLPGVRWWRTLHFATARMKMYDTELDEHVRFARHAISIDEQRGSFERVPWGIPGQWKSGMPIWFEQVWFAGNHSDIGGSYAEDESRLSDIALDWMANAAVEVGLGVDHSVLRVTPDPRGRRKHAAASAGRRREPSHASRPPFTRLEGEVGSAMEKGSATPSCCRLAQTGTVVASLHTRGSTMNYYEILGVDRGAEQEVIDAAFRAMMRRYHPDTFTGPNAEADRRAKQLNEAYAVLRHPDRRHAYDATLGPVAPPSPPVFETLPNPGRSQPVNRAVMILAGTAAVGALVMVFYLNRPTAAVPVAPVAATDAAVLPAPPEPSPVLIPASTPSPTLFAACRGMACRVMTPFGWGGIEAGVTTDSAQQASAMKIRDDGHYTDAGDGTCLAYEVIGGPKNLQMLVESGVVTTVEAYLDPAGSVFRTDRGVKLGDPESDVRKAYKGLKQLPDIYSEPPDKKLFHYEPGGERGIKFSINGGKVTGISVGSRSIEYVEGCL